MSSLFLDISFLFLEFCCEFENGREKTLIRAICKKREHITPEITKNHLRCLWLKILDFLTLSGNYCRQLKAVCYVHIYKFLGGTRKGPVIDACITSVSFFWGREEQQLYFKPILIN